MLVMQEQGRHSIMYSDEQASQLTITTARNAVACCIIVDSYWYSPKRALCDVLAHEPDAAARHVSKRAYGEF